MIFIPYTWAGYVSYQGMNLAIPLTLLKFSRDAARQADSLGLQYLYKSGYDPERYLQFFERIVQSQSPAKAVPKAFSPLPPLTDRVKAMREEIDQFMPQRDAATVTSSEFEAVQERLQSLPIPKVHRPKQTHLGAKSPTQASPLPLQENFRLLNFGISPIFLRLYD